MGSATTKKSSVYSPELAETILRRLAEGESLAKICRDPTMPAYSTIALWAVNDIEGWSERYQRAKQMRADYHIEQSIDIVDDAHQEIRELKDPRLSSGIGKIVGERVRARHWMASRAHPNHWGDKSQVDVSALVSVIAPEAIKKAKNAGIGVTQAALPEGEDTTKEKNS